MIHTLAVENYRSLRSISVPLGELNVIQGANGSGKSNLYRALRLLADTASGGIVSSLAREGGLGSIFWAGPERLSRDMRTGRVPIQGTQRKEAVRLKLGFAGEDFSYCITMGLPVPSGTRDLDFEVDRRTDSYPAQRGREERIYEQHPEADLNKQRPISPTNPRRAEYLQEGDKL